MFKTFEEAAIAVDEMFNVAFQNAGRKLLYIDRSLSILTPFSHSRGEW